jgi:phosphoribosylamine--glycine ligase
VIVSYKIGFAGTDGIRGMPAMPPFAMSMQWPVKFIPTADNSKEAYATAIIAALKNGSIDCVVPMPEDLLLDGLLDNLEEVGLLDHVIGFTRKSSFIEGDKIACKYLCDKIACKYLCHEYNIPVADKWYAVDARNYQEILRTCLVLLDLYGGAVLKYPYSAGGKGSRIILNSWEIKEVYDTFIKDYAKNYKQRFGKKSEWPLLIESRMSGVEISFIILVDKNGSFQILPTSMDYPERFPGPASKDNPITGTPSHGNA